MLFSEAIAAVDWTSPETRVPLIIWRLGLQALVEVSHGVRGRAILPRRIAAADRAALERDGVVFRQLVNGDPDFCWALLPKGWELVLRWEWRRIELLDQQRRVRAVITYRAAYGMQRRQARLGAVIRGGVEHPAGWSSGPSDEWDVVRQWETANVETEVRTNPPKESGDVDRLYTIAGLRMLASPPDGWMLLPTGVVLDDVLPALARFTVAPLNGDPLFSWVRRVGDVWLRFNNEELCVDVFDSLGVRVAALLYETSPLGDRWACVMPTIDAPAGSVPLAASAAGGARIQERRQVTHVH
jgi:hypothetical protein